MNSVEFQVGRPKATAFWDSLVDFDCTEEASQKEMSKRHGCAILVFRQVLKRSPKGGRRRYIEYSCYLDQAGFTSL